MNDATINGTHECGGEKRVVAIETKARDAGADFQLADSLARFEGPEFDATAQAATQHQLQTNARFDLERFKRLQ